MKNNVLTHIILKLLRVGAGEKLEKVLKTSPLEEIQQLFSQLDDHQKKRFLALLFNKSTASKTIRDFDSVLLSEIFSHVPIEVLFERIDELELDDISRFLEKLPEEQRKGVLDKFNPDRRRQISRLLAYDKDSAGAFMNPSFFTLPQSSTVNEAVSMLRTKTQLEMVFYLYVVDEDKHLVGIISLRQLIMSPGEALLKEIMDANVVRVNVNQIKSEVAQLISRYNFLALPVVDDDSRIVGVITVDDMIDVIQEQAEKDLYRMAGLEKDERVFSPVKQAVKRRAPWLIINLATAILAAQVVGLFESTISKAVLLATFLPVVAGMGGNAGTQTLTIVIRGIAMGELAFKETKRALIKEVSVGLFNGIITGLIVAVVAYVWKGLPVLGLVLMLSMIGNLIVSSTVGVLIPVMLKAVKIDPAVASTVIVTTFTDCFGFFSFLGLASLLLKFLV